MNYALPLPRRLPARPQRLPRAAAARGGLRRRRRRRTCPSSGSCRPPSRATPGRRATRGTSSARPAARPAARRRRSPPGSCPSPTATTAAARCASRPRAAASSASSRAAGASRAGPTSASPTSACEGVLTRTVTETAQLLDVLAGYEAGDATWAPRPAEPYATAIRRHPGRLRIAVSLDNSARRRGGRGVRARGARRGRAPVATSATRSSRRRRRCPRPDVAGGLPPGLRPAVALGDHLRRADRGPARRATTTSSRSRGPWPTSRATLPSTGYLAALTQLQALARSTIAFFADHDLLLTPVLASRPLRDRRAARLRRGPDGRPAPLGRVRPVHARCSTSPGSLPISVPLGFGEDGLPSAVQLVGRPLGEDTLLQVAGQLELARPWAQHLPPLVA